MYRWPAARVAILGILFSCTHDQPFSIGSYAPGGPLGAGTPLRLTYNTRDDFDATWLPDGSGIVYTREHDDRADLDRCLALLPPAGGTIEREICDQTPAAADSVDAYTAAAISSQGRLAYVRATASFAVGWPLVPHDQELVLGTLADPFAVRVLLPSIPYPSPSGRVHQGVAQVHWLGDSSLVYVGRQVSYPGVCMPCGLRDTLASGLEIVRIDFGSASAVLHVLPGTDQASSVAVASQDTIYFTLNGDTRVFRLALANDSAAVFHDFGAGNVARDVQVAAGRVLAVVGGKVTDTTDGNGGLIQRDSGGTIVMVDPATGSETPLAVGSLFRHPALSPDGRHAVAETYVGRSTDLWLLDVP